jgi:MOSC domain-containing protein YiiM
MAQLEAGLQAIRESPADRGTVMMIVRRPKVGVREVLQSGELDLVDGLMGDNWRARGNPYTPDRSALLDAQITITNARAIALVAQTKERWPLAGDQLYIDMDLSAVNLPPGSRLKLGSATVEVTAQPHTGCKNFTARFGVDAMKFVNSPVGRQLNLRGINTRVVQAGVVRVGDIAVKTAAAENGR